MYLLVGALVLAAALRLLHARSHGPWLLGCVGLGLAAYGAYRLACARFRRIRVESRAAQPPPLARSVPEQLRGDPATAGVPLIVLSAHVLPDDRERAFRSGADAFLAKPLDGARLLAEVGRFGRGDGP